MGPVVALISNSLTPYRLHFHRRLVREVGGIEWWSLFTHDVSNAPWSLSDEAEIRPVRFGIGERADDQSRLSRAPHEYSKGGRVIRWLQEHRAAAVVLLGYNDAGRLRILRWCRRAGVPCFVFGDSNIRGDIATGPKAWLKRSILPRILRQATGALPCGTLGREFFRKYGVPDDRIWYMPYEPDYALIDRVTSEDVTAVFAKFDLAIGRPYLLFCGRLVGVKRVDLLMDGFAAIAAERPDWELIIAGDGPLRQELEGRLPTAVRPRVHWLGFIDDQATVAALGRGAKALVLPSDNEPWGVVINEAVAAGMAVVASDVVGAAAELVRDGVNGRLFPRGDSAALTVALREVTASVDRYRSASAGVLAEWHRVGDPVAGLSAALASVGIKRSEGC